MLARALGVLEQLVDARRHAGERQLDVARVRVAERTGGVRHERLGHDRHVDDGLLEVRQSHLHVVLGVHDELGERVYEALEAGGDLAELLDLGLHAHEQVLDAVDELGQRLHPVAEGERGEVGADRDELAERARLLVVLEKVFGGGSLLSGHVVDEFAFAQLRHVDEVPAVVGAYLARCPLQVILQVVFDLRVHVHAVNVFYSCLVSTSYRSKYIRCVAIALFAYLFCSERFCARAHY